jgi:hypothetical protein
MADKTVIDLETGEVTTEPLMPEEEEQRQALENAAVESHWTAFGAERDGRLAASDWTQLPDAQLPPGEVTAWADYRQQLRDLPETTVDPTTPEWPVPPEVPSEFLLAALDPESVQQGVGQVTLRALGSGFTSVAKIVLDGVELPTAFRSSGELTTTVDASEGGHAAGTFDVLVRQDGQDSVARPFTIS